MITNITNKEKNRLTKDEIIKLLEQQKKIYEFALEKKEQINEK